MWTLASLTIHYAGYSGASVGFGDHGVLWQYAGAVLSLSLSDCAPSCPTNPPGSYHANSTSHDLQLLTIYNCVEVLCAV